MPFAALLGIELDMASREEVHGRLAWDASRCTVGGVMHGGALISFADTLGAICAFLNLPEGAGTATIESKTNLFRAVRSGVVRGVCRPLHLGRSTIVVQTDLYDDADRRVAQVTQTQSILPA
jgi:1,4-dihydroxy-2-naphthoyl-CoA hydrolase